MYAPWNGSNLSQKATEALERKKRNDVKGQIMAEYRAQKEAERKDKFGISVTVELRAFGKKLSKKEKYKQEFKWFVESTTQRVCSPSPATKRRNMTGDADVAADKDDATPKNVREPADDE
nr:hypothetical protein [Tanacetum cinerariifolium]